MSVRNKLVIFIIVLLVLDQNPYDDWGRIQCLRKLVQNSFY